jgi:hypothetical protein
MNNKQKKTLSVIFKNPISSNIEYREIISLFKAMDAKIIEDKSGSRVGIILKGYSITIHAPHPQKEMKKYAIRDIREFLLKTGVKI